MLAQGTALLTAAHAERRAIAAFTTYTLESTRAICLAAEHTGRSVIIQAGSSSFGGVGRELLAETALAAARRSSAALGLHLDHSTDLDEIRWCIAFGYTSVMVDGSHLGFEDNVALTTEVVREAHRTGIWVEGELGALAGDESTSTNATAGERTDPDLAAEFASRTGVDALAVSVGNVHGLTATPIRLDLERLRHIAALTAVPLVLHGASGLLDEDLVDAVDAGVAKVNINTELRRAYLGSLGAALDERDDDIRRLQRGAISAMTEVATDRINLLGGRPLTQ
jgi:fructose-bisphosphate aldolase class II/tagatose 1,6-diphosphate aldolase GatY/KbaY